MSEHVRLPGANLTSLARNRLPACPNQLHRLCSVYTRGQVLSRQQTGCVQDSPLATHLLAISLLEKKAILGAAVNSIPGSADTPACSKMRLSPSMRFRRWGGCTDSTPKPLHTPCASKQCGQDSTAQVVGRFACGTRSKSRQLTPLHGCSKQCTADNAIQYHGPLGPAAPSSTP